MRTRVCYKEAGIRVLICVLLVRFQVSLCARKEYIHMHIYIFALIHEFLFSIFDGGKKIKTNYYPADLIRCVRLLQNPQKERKKEKYINVF